jgi:hypothetical protein
MFEDTKEVFRSRSLSEPFKGLNIFYEKGPLYFLQHHIKITQAEIPFKCG